MDYTKALYIVPPRCRGQIVEYAYEQGGEEWTSEVYGWISGGGFLPQQWFPKDGE